jgi:hypothetical protein
MNAKWITRFLLCWAVGLGQTFTWAQEAKELTGLTTFSKFYREQFIAALYLSEDVIDAEAIINSDKDKRMLMLFSGESMSARKFHMEWGASIEMNNNGLDDYHKVALKGGGLDEFLRLPKKVSDGKFYTNDMLSIELARSEKTGNINTVVKYNEKIVLAKKGGALFRVLLRGWIGETPPSEDFKNQLLGKDRIRNYEELVFYLRSVTRTS